MRALARISDLLTRSQIDPSLAREEAIAGIVDERRREVGGDLDDYAVRLERDPDLRRGATGALAGRREAAIVALRRRQSELEAWERSVRRVDDALEADEPGAAARALADRPRTALAAAAAVLAETLALSPAPWPLPTAPVALPAAHAALAAEPGDTATWDFPPENRAANRWYEALAVAHGKRIPYGVNTFLPARFARNHFVRALMGCLRRARRLVGGWSFWRRFAAAVAEHGGGGGGGTGGGLGGGSGVERLPSESSKLLDGAAPEQPTYRIQRSTTSHSALSWAEGISGGAPSAVPAAPPNLDATGTTYSTTV